MNSFCCEYWNWLRGLRRDEPNPADYGLDEQSAESLRRQCQIEFRAKTDPRQQSLIEI